MCIFKCICTTFILVQFIVLRSLEKRYEAVLDRELAKEIARSLYQTIHSECSYTNRYRSDDTRHQGILNSSLEEFKRLIKLTNICEIVLIQRDIYQSFTKYLYNTFTHY